VPAREHKSTLCDKLKRETGGVVKVTHRGRTSLRQREIGEGQELFIVRE